MKLRIAWLSLALTAVSLDASTTTSWEINSYQDFLGGRFSGISLSRDGRLLLAPKVDTVFDSGQPIIWSVIRAKDGTIYVGTGHRGRVFRIDPSGNSTLLWTADQPEVFALALDAKGRLYAATSPKGKVYRFEDGKAREFFAPDAVYIWALVFDRDGTLYVGTGDQGKVFRVDSSGKGALYYETGQSHVTSLALDPQGRLLAGTEPNGLLYRIYGKGRAFVLYDAELPEIRAITCAPNGTIYAAAQGGGRIGRSPAGAIPTRISPTVPQATISTSISVTEDAQGGVEIKPKPEAAKPATPPAVTPPQPPPTVTEVAGVEKSAIYAIAPDNTVETLWSSKEENVYDLLASGQDLVFTTDGQGRIYRLSRDRKLTLLTQTNEGEGTRLVQDASSVIVTTGDLGKVLRLGSGLTTRGVYEAPVHDAGKVARWGRLSWHTQASDAGRIVFYTRSGNSVRPDQTWSDWSAPLTDPKGSLVPSPNARYIQWKVEFITQGGTSPSIDSVTLAYLPQNSPPVIRSIQAVLQTSAVSPAKQPASQAPSTSFSITVTDTGEPAPTTSSGTPTQVLTRPAGRQLSIFWQAEDPDNDRLVYSLYFRGEDETEWKLLKGDLYQTNYQIDGDVLADGKYFFKIKASDLPSNPPETAREVELVSAPVLIDNTPPLVKVEAPRWTPSHIEIDFTAQDAASCLRRAEYSVDAGAWTPLQAADGVIDSPQENFHLQLPQLSPGEHVVVLRVYDSAENAGLAKVVLRSP